MTSVKIVELLSLFDMHTTIFISYGNAINNQVPAEARMDAQKGSSEPGIGRAILKDMLVIVVAAVAIMSFYFFVKAFSILANIP